MSLRGARQSLGQCTQHVAEFSDLLLELLLLSFECLELLLTDTVTVIECHLTTLKATPIVRWGGDIARALQTAGQRVQENRTRRRKYWPEVNLGRRTRQFDHGAARFLRYLRIKHTRSFVGSVSVASSGSIPRNVETHRERSKSADECLAVSGHGRDGWNHGRDGRKHVCSALIGTVQWRPIDAII